jgi:hypothetical protein
MICVLQCLMAGAPALAQGFGEHVAQAQQTLTEIDRLLDTIGARQAAPPGNRTIAVTAVAEAVGSKSLFDGASLAGWKVTDFFGGGKAHVEPNYRGGPAAIVVEAGTSLSGITWTGDAPKTNYEITLEAMKIEGQDFMCGLTFPVGDSYASLILGGWGGNLVGISSIDEHDASENDTRKYITFPKDRWFAIRMRVTPAKLQAWLDGKKIVDASIVGKKISLRFGEIKKSAPIGLANYRTSSAFRAIKLRQLDSAGAL